MILAIILSQGFIFLALIFLLRQFMKGHVSGAVGHLQKLNDELVKQQTELKQRAAAAQSEYDAKMAQLQQEISLQQTQTREEITKSLEDSRTRALQEREKIINEAVETREKMRQEIMAEMEQKAISHSKSLIAEFFTGELRRLVHEALVKDLIEGLREVDLEHFQIQTTSANLKAAEPLRPEHKKEIQGILKQKIKKEVEFLEETDASLIGGLILKLGTFVIDGSLTNRLADAASRLKKETARKYQGTV